MKIEFDGKIDSDGHPWEGERVGPENGPKMEVGDAMPHASNALLAVGDLLPSFTDWGGGEPPAPPILPGSVMEPPNMSEEEWLRELAKRIEKMVPRFGAVDKQVRRELELAVRMINSYAVLWERRNQGIMEDVKKRGDAL